MALDELAVIGKPEHRDKQIKAIVTGKLDFAADRNPQGKLYASVLASPHAHAKITSIDTSKAEALPGVKAVVTYKDCPYLSQVLIFWGQEVAAVAAETPYIAERALQLIDVTYETRPAIINPEDALKPGAPLTEVWPDTNVKVRTNVNRGDINAGFQQADVIVDEMVGWTGFYQHGTVEPESAVCWWLGDDLYIQLHNRDPFGKRFEAAFILSMPIHKIHLFGHGCGGSHGSIANCQPHIIAASLAKKAGLPVQLHLSRRNNYLQGAHQVSAKAHIKLGCKKDGTLVAADLEYWGDGGSNPNAFVYNGTNSFAQTFICPNGRFVVNHIATNKPKTATWRNVWEPWGSYLVSVVEDKMAEKLGMDPLAFRMKNLIPPTMAHQDTKVAYASNGMKETFEKVASAIGWSSKWHAPGTKTLPDGRLHGIGITGHLSTFCNMWANVVGAIVNMTEDGRALINVGISRVGGGTSSALCHIVAEQLGIKYEDVSVGEWGNTDVATRGTMQAGSTSTITSGAAFYNAAKNAREQIFAKAADALGTTSDKLDAKDGNIFVKTDPSKSTTYADVCTKKFSGYTVVGTGYSWRSELRRPVGDFKIGTPSQSYNATATAVELAVDPDTGELEILSMVNASDPGRAIFRRGAEGQIDGGSEIQVGEAMFYEQIFDQSNGATLNPHFLNHRFPTTMDLYSNRQQCIVVETGDACGPYDCHGLGEPPVQSYECFAAAIYNATGKWIHEPPHYPWKTLKALGKA